MENKNEYQRVFDALTSENNNIINASNYCSQPAVTNPPNSAAENIINSVSDIVLIQNQDFLRCMVVLFANKHFVYSFVLVKEENEKLKIENSKLNEIVKSMDSRLKATFIIVEKMYGMLRNQNNTGEIQRAETETDKNLETFESMFSFAISNSEVLNNFNKYIEANELYRKFLVCTLT